MVMSLGHYSMIAGLYSVTMLIRIQAMYQLLRHQPLQHMVLHSLTVRFSQKRDAQEVSITLQDLGEQMLILLGLTAIWVRY